MGQSFSQQTLKVNAKMAVSRLSLMRSKKSNLLHSMKREIANLLSQGKVPNAEIKAESLIHEENLIIATEILELHCEKIASRAGQIASQPKCPEDIFISIATIVYCSTRLPVPEFKGVATQMALKYTKAWIMPLNDRKQYVDPKVLALIDITPPSRSEIVRRLAELAEEFNVEYESPNDEPASKPSSSTKEQPLQPDEPPVKGKPGLLQLYEDEAKKPTVVVSPRRSSRQDAELQELEALKSVATHSDPNQTDLKLPESTPAIEVPDGNEPDQKEDEHDDQPNARNEADVDELMKRLEALKSP